MDALRPGESRLSRAGDNLGEQSGGSLGRMKERELGAVALQSRVWTRKNCSYVIDLDLGLDAKEQCMSVPFCQEYFHKLLSLEQW